MKYLAPYTPRQTLGVVVLGGGPSPDDVQRGEALTGNIRSYVSDTFESAGLPLGQVHFVNAWACQSPVPLKDKMARAAVAACRPLVQAELAKHAPGIPVMLAGKWALLSVTGTERGLTARRGYIDREWTTKAEVEAEGQDSPSDGSSERDPSSADEDLEGT